ncbi:MAG: hypothetical protein ABI905_13570, partial [Betaproteobacteria bacterium]
TTPTMSRWCSNQLSYVPAEAAILAEELMCPQRERTFHLGEAGANSRISLFKHKHRRGFSATFGL